MKHLIPALTLLALSTTASANNWIAAARTDAGSIYLDATTLRAPTPTTRRMWIMLSAPAESIKTYYEWDCQAMTVRALHMIRSDKPDGGGKVTATDESIQPARFFAPDSIHAAVADIICRPLTKASKML